MMDPTSNEGIDCKAAFVCINANVIVGNEFPIAWATASAMEAAIKDQLGSPVVQVMIEEVEEDDTAEEEGAAEMSSADKLLFVVCWGSPC